LQAAQSALGLASWKSALGLEERAEVGAWLDLELVLERVAFVEGLERAPDVGEAVSHGDSALERGVLADDSLDLRARGVDSVAPSQPEPSDVCGARQVRRVAPEIFGFDEERTDVATELLVIIRRQRRRRRDDAAREGLDSRNGVEQALRGSHVAVRQLEAVSEHRDGHRLLLFGRRRRRRR